VRSCVSLLALLLVGCPNGSDGSSDDKTDDSGDTDTTAEPRTIDDFVDVTTPYVAADATCWTPGTLTTQTPDPTCQNEVSVTGKVEDFQTGDGVPDISVQIWNSDDITGSADAVATADGSGNFDATIPTCTPFGYGTSTPPEWKETKDTYEVHQTYGPDVTSVTFNSVSEATSRLIPGLIGIDWDETTGIIAGAVYDCNEDPIQYAQIFFHDADGNVPGQGDIFYFSVSGDTELPTTREAQPYTNTNGLWVAINVPDGDWTVEAWGYDGADHVLLGATQLTIQAGSVNISNVHLGISDGLAYPASCLSPCE
jgi:hypothetical protein